MLVRRVVEGVLAEGTEGAEEASTPWARFCEAERVATIVAFFVFDLREVAFFLLFFPQLLSRGTGLSARKEDGGRGKGQQTKEGIGC